MRKGGGEAGRMRVGTILLPFYVHERDKNRGNFHANVVVSKNTCERRNSLFPSLFALAGRSLLAE